MKKLSIKISFYLTKKDAKDFDRNLVSSIFNIVPTQTCQPTMSKGKIHCENIEETEKEMLITIIRSDTSPYKYLKHAFWLVETPELRTFDEAIKNFKDTIQGKEKEIVQVCKELNLDATLVITLYGDLNDAPHISFSTEDISLFSTLGIAINFNFESK